jgi:hypothetical protein
MASEDDMLPRFSPKLAAKEVRPPPPLESEDSGVIETEQV